MADFDFKEKFPISQYIQGVIEKKKVEEASKLAGRQQLLQGLQSIGGVAQGMLDTREALAKEAKAAAEAQDRSMAQADLLARMKPEYLDAFGASEQVGNRQLPLPEGQIGPVNQVPVTRGETPDGRKQVLSSLAKAIQGISGDQLLENIKADPYGDALKQAKAGALSGGKGGDGKPQLRQNAFTGEWEWHFPPAAKSGGSSQTPRKNVPASGGASSETTGPRGTFRDVAKAVAETSDARSIAESVTAELDRVDVLNQNSRGGLLGGAIQRGSSALNIGTDTPEFKNTADVINTLRGQVSKVLKSTFGGQLSDKERDYLDKVYGAAESMTPAERAIAIKNVKTMINDARIRAENKLSALQGRPAQSKSDDFSSLSDEELRRIAAGGK